MKNLLPRILVIGALVGLVAAFFAFDLGQYLTLDALKENRADLQELIASNPWLYGLIFFVVYVIVTGASLPGAAILTLAGGALFGTLKGTIIVSFASSIGATLAFLMARFLLRDWVQGKFGSYLNKINQELEKDGAFYLFTLRLVPAFPFFVINLVMGLTPIKVGTFYIISQLGMLAGTVVYVNAGTQIGQLESLGGILTPQFIGSFVALGLLPLIAKKGVAFIQSKKAV